MQPTKHCKRVRKYIQSPYEKRHYEKTLELLELYPKYEERRQAFLEFITGAKEVEETKTWLHRVEVRMASAVDLEVTPEDLKYLSRFATTISCYNAEPYTLPLEFIEPLSIHFRHPFGLAKLANINDIMKFPFNLHEIFAGLNITEKQHHTTIANVDYILVLSDDARHRLRSKHYFFDAGSSRWDSSLFWFVCAYLQRALRFDQLYAWEYTVMDPRDYWLNVPPLLKPILTFFNIPITEKEGSMENPLDFIKNTCTEQDFVSFKLDVDNPGVEIPIALSVANDPTVFNLIDELFFELHFNRELMTPAPQMMSPNLPHVYKGLRMDRVGAYDLFIKMRNNGIRAHAWP